MTSKWRNARIWFCSYKCPCSFLNVWTIFTLPWTSCVAIVFSLVYQKKFSKCLRNCHFCRHMFLFCGMESIMTKVFSENWFGFPQTNFSPVTKRKTVSYDFNNCTLLDPTVNRSLQARLGPKSGWLHLWNSSQEPSDSDSDLDEVNRLLG